MERAHRIEWLVLRAQSGDRGAMEALLTETQALLRPYLGAMAGDPDLAGDVLQEVLITIFRKLHALQASRAYIPWTRRIASRALFAALRRSRRYEPLGPEIEAELVQASDAALAEAEPDLVDAMPALLQRVSPASREVLVLHYLEELTIEEIGAVLDLPTGTVKSRLAYGLATLRRLIGQRARA